MAAALPHGAFPDDAATRPGQHTWMHAIVRWLCITVSLTFLAAVLLAPLATVFAMALARGLTVYWRSANLATAQWIPERFPKSRHTPSSPDCRSGCTA